MRYDKAKRALKRGYSVTFLFAGVAKSTLHGESALAEFVAKHGGKMLRKLLKIASIE